MDTVARNLANYCVSINYDDLTPDVVHRTKLLLIDALACGFGGYNSKPAEIARRLAGQVQQSHHLATIMGSGQKSSLELATFANGVMIRFLDFNDSYFGKEGGHPSDNFAPILSCADSVHSCGREVIVASVLAYEVFCRIADRITLGSKGWDHAITGVISSVIGVSKILGLSREQVVEAINLVIAPNISLFQTRAGEISMWKGCALPNAARNAVFAALLAKEGMTGPSPIFEGKYGLFNVVTGPFQLEKFGGDNRPFRIMDTMVKQYPCGTFAQTAIDAALKLRNKITALDEIANINIGTFTLGKIGMGTDLELWHPKTRESADHSMPFAVAVSLMFGRLDLKHFSDEYLHNPDLLDLMSKITVEETEECNTLYPNATANRVEITTKSGKKLSELVQYHRGHSKNFLTEEEIENKFYSLSDGLLPKDRSKKLISRLWNLEDVDDIDEIMKMTQIG